jgi:hypothetical protein
MESEGSYNNTRSIIMASLFRGTIATEKLNENKHRSDKRISSEHLNRLQRAGANHRRYKCVFCTPILAVWSLDLSNRRVCVILVIATTSRIEKIAIALDIISVSIDSTIFRSLVC